MRLSGRAVLRDALPPHCPAGPFDPFGVLLPLNVSIGAGRNFSVDVCDGRLVCQKRNEPAQIAKVDAVHVEPIAKVLPSLGKRVERGGARGNCCVEEV